jgi:hypothetical protein
VLLVIAVLALGIWPWANQQTQDLRDRYGKRGDLERVTPGQFQESASGSRVFFIDKDTPDNRSGKNIFISTTERGKETVTSARSGRMEIVGDQQFLLLVNGQRLESTGNGSELKISEFEEYGNRMGGVSLGDVQLASQGPLHPHPVAGAHPHPPGRAGLAHRPGAGRAQLCGDCRHRVQRPTRAPGAAATWCLRCLPSSSTTTC